MEDQTTHTQPITQPRTTIDLVFPAYNEEHRIEPVLRQYGQFYNEHHKSNNYRVQLVVVTNGCTDQTLSVVKRVQHDFPALVVIIDIPEAVGKGGAVYRGWDASSADIVAFVDADGATSAEEMDKLLSYLVEHDTIDGVVGSRFIGGATVINRTSVLRSIMSRFFILFVRWLFWLSYQDTQCGAKAFRRSAYLEVRNELHERHLQFDVELLWRLKQHRKYIVELPTIWVDQPASAQLGNKWDFLRIGFGMVLNLLSLRFRSR
jgi:dolichol-phosphate mannosyltransferase